ncbi:S26 family signal peptidase [Geomobilimonas luticola]|uniref:S26 family signal peptidase n=1 Tax=Geomobilimonas luticola TaxID=1114878 RepID=A0ABS5SBS4_9BACT|nr:S26 family signal peptidase [Geomobilimonas luticola]MBT0652625.1 S26 family signal peptidase [Geomobilimonas luticola]
MPKPLNLDFHNWRLWMAITCLLVAGTLLPYKFSVTLTPSLKHRIYWLTRNPDKVVRGDYVLFHHKELAAKVGMKKSEEMLKVLGCNEGDQLTVDAEKKFYCNGEYMVRAKDISLKGEPLQHFVFNGQIPKGVMFVMGQHKDSYDSRYFGFVDKNRILAKAYPIF